MRTKQLTALLICLLYSVGSYADHIDLNDASLSWDFVYDIDLGLNSKQIETDIYHPGDKFEISLTGRFSLYFASGDQQWKTIGIDLSSIYLTRPDGTIIRNADIGSAILTPKDDFTSTSLFTYQIADSFTIDACLNNFDYATCLETHSSGNTSLDGHINAGNLESGLDLTLDLNYISLINNGDGTSNFDFTNFYQGFLGNLGNITLSLIASDNDYTTTYDLNPNPIPLPAAIWLFLSGCIALFGFNKRTIT